MAGASSKSPDKAPATPPQQQAQPLSSFYLDAAMNAGSTAPGGGGSVGGGGGGPVSVGGPITLGRGVVATFQLRVHKGKAQVFVADPSQAVFWNGTALDNESDYDIRQGDWSDLDDVEKGTSTQYYLNIHLKMRFDRKLEKHTVKETIDGEEKSVDRLFAVDKFVAFDNKEYKITSQATSGDPKDEWIAKEPDGEGGGGALAASPFVRWRKLAMKHEENETVTLEAEVNHTILLGGIYDGKARNNVIGALQLVNFVGTESYRPEDEEGGSSDSGTSDASGSSESGTVSESGTAGESSTSGEGGETTTSGGHTSTPGGETTGPGPGPGPGGTGTSDVEEFEFVGDIRYVCPNIEKRVDKYNPKTGKVTVGQWTVIQGGTCVPHSGEHE